MNEETVLFNRFNTLMKTRTQMMKGFEEKLSEPESTSTSKEARSYQDLVRVIMEDKKWLQEQTEIPSIYVKHYQEYRKYTLETEIPSMEEIKKLETNTHGRGKREQKTPEQEEEEKNKKKEYLIKLLEKFGRFYVLDITREITLLSQIKDIQDELEMMEKVFIEQKEVLEAMDRIIQSMQRSNLGSDDEVKAGNLDARSHPRYILNRKNTEGEHYDELSSSDSSILGDVYSSSSSSGKSQKKKNNAQSVIWGLGHQKQNLPLRTVNRHSKQIQKMIKRAKSTNSAVCNSLPPVSLIHALGNP